MPDPRRRPLPEITLRSVDATRAQAILDGEPLPDDVWASGYPNDGDRQAATLALRLMNQNDDSPFWFFEVVNVAGTVVGGAGFHAPPDKDGTVEIGYGIADSVRNRGFAQAVITQLVAIASTNGASRVLARTDRDNGPSRAALQRCGFATVESAEDDFVHHVQECLDESRSGRRR